jgi:hypothetical protein
MLGSSGWVMDWNLQEPDGLVAHARNKAVALGRELLVKDFTAGLWEVLAATIDDSDSFTTAGQGLVRANDPSIAAAKTYTVRVKGTTTATSLLINDYANVNIYKTITGSGAFDETFSFTALDDGIAFFNDSAGTTDIDWANTTIKQTDIEASSTKPGPELLGNGPNGFTFTGGVIDWWTTQETAESEITEVGSGEGHGGAGTGSSNFWATVTDFNPRIIKAGLLTVGKRYKNILETSLVNNGAIQPWSGALLDSSITSAEKKSFEFVASNTSFHVWALSAATDVTLDNISIREANPLNADHVGVTVGVDGNDGGILRAARYDGGTTYTQLPASMISSMMDFTKGTIHVWARVSGAGVWTDGIDRYLCSLRADDANRIIFIKASTNNTMRVYTEFGNTVKFTNITTSQLNMFMITLTWDTTTDEMRIYLNNALQDILTGLGTWVGNLDSTTTTIGARNTTPTSVWDGDIAYIPIANQAQSQAEITAQYLKGV